MSTTVRDLLAVQNRIVEFLGELDDADLRALIAGTRRLRLDDGTTDRPSPSGTLSDRADPADSAQATVRALTAADSVDARRAVLRAARLSVRELKQVARELRLVGYSALRRDELLTLLTGEHAAGREVPPAPGGRSEDAATTTVDAAAVAARLRTFDRETDGADYLTGLALDRSALLAVAGSLGLTRVDRLATRQLRARILTQAIGARRRFAGLRAW